MKYLKGIHKEVYNIFFIYMGIYYAFPFVMNLIYPNEYKETYVGLNSSVPAIYVLVSLILVLILNAVVPQRKGFFFKNIGSVYEKKALNIIIALIFLATSIQFASNHTLNFRQSASESISGAGGYVIIMFGVRSYIKIFFLYLLLKYTNNLPTFRYQRILALIATFSMIISITGSLDLLFAFIGLIIFFKKENMLFDKFKGGLRSNIVRIALILIIAVVVVFIGTADKVGVESASDSFTNSKNAENILLHTAKRISVWYVSVLAIGNQDVLDNERSFIALDGIFNNLDSRLGILFGDKKQRVQGVWSVNRMNFLQIYRDKHNDRTGAAPGLVASSFYMPFFPLNFIIIALYTIFMLRTFSKGFVFAKYQLNIFSRFILLFFFISLFDSPIDLINFVGEGFIFFIFFLGAMDKIGYVSYQKYLKQVDLKRKTAQRIYAT